MIFYYRIWWHIWFVYVFFSPQLFWTSLFYPCFQFFFFFFFRPRCCYNWRLKGFPIQSWAVHLDKREANLEQERKGLGRDPWNSINLWIYLNFMDNLVRKTGTNPFCRDVTGRRIRACFVVSIKVNSNTAMSQRVFFFFLVQLMFKKYKVDFSGLGILNDLWQTPLSHTSWCQQNHQSDSFLHQIIFNILSCSFF